MVRLLFILVSSLALAAGTTFSQAVEWSFPSSGFAFSRSASTTLISSIGEPFVGFSQMGSISIRSGSLSRNFMVVTGLKETEGQLPLDYTLYQNYPNPFNPSTTVRYDLPSAAFVTLRIFDILGQCIATLVEEEKPAGVHRVSINLPNLPSGVYLYRIQAGEYVNTKKFILLR